MLKKKKFCKCKLQGVTKDGIHVTHTDRLRLYWKWKSFIIYNKICYGPAVEKWNDLQNPQHYSLNVICLIMTDCSV